MVRELTGPPLLQVAEATALADEPVEQRRGLPHVALGALPPTLSIAGHAISSLIHTQGLGDLYRIFLTAQRDGLDFKLAYIPSHFNAPHKEEFDTEYMRALFNLGYAMAAGSYPREKVPPDYTSHSR